MARKDDFDAFTCGADGGGALFFDVTNYSFDESLWRICFRIFFSADTTLGSAYKLAADRMSLKLFQYTPGLTKLKTLSVCGF